MQLHERPDHGARAHEARAVEVSVVLQGPREEIPERREGIKDDREGRDRNGEHPARIGRPGMEGDVTAHAEALEEDAVRASPARKGGKRKPPEGEDRRAKKCVSMTDVPDVVRDEREDFRRSENLHGVRKNDDAAALSPTREHDVAVLPEARAVRDDEIRHREAFGSEKVADHGAEGFVAHRPDAAVPEKAVDDSELAAPEEIKKPGDPEKEPPVVSGEVKGGKRERDEGERCEVARHGFADPAKKRPLCNAALDAVALFHALPHVPAERKFDDEREKEQESEREPLRGLSGAEDCGARRGEHREPLTVGHEPGKKGAREDEKEFRLRDFPRVVGGSALSRFARASGEILGNFSGLGVGLVRVQCSQEALGEDEERKGRVKEDLQRVRGEGHGGNQMKGEGNENELL